MRRMSRPLSPFVRHLGEAKHRTRQLRLGVERVHEAALATAGEGTGAAALQHAIDDVRRQLALLEALASRWADERAAPAGCPRGAALREEIGAWLGRDDRVRPR
jgi:hypothetical protein